MFAIRILACVRKVIRAPENPLPRRGKQSRYPTFINFSSTSTNRIVRFLRFVFRSMLFRRLLEAFARHLFWTTLRGNVDRRRKKKKKLTNGLHVAESKCTERASIATPLERTRLVKTHRLTSYRSVSRFLTASKQASAIV